MIVIYRNEQAVPTPEHWGNGTDCAVSGMLVQLALHTFQLDILVFVAYSHKPFFFENVADKEHFEEGRIPIQHCVSQFVHERRTADGTSPVGLPRRVGASGFVALDRKRAHVAIWEYMALRWFLWERFRHRPSSAGENNDLELKRPREGPFPRHPPMIAKPNS
ncbi:hypothetical protein, partial [Gordonibacter urolithinfaciens]|uniref:hypothetical protein n=1 Tax=Gordonibacter urolithinfaciens TaxID=1335613 RepID=UPI003A8D5955